MIRPSISVVIPSYNRRATIGRALDSAMAQTVPPLEIIVADDASRDSTAQWLAQAYPSVRVIALDRNRGAAGARNAAMAIATGELIAFLDSDDWWAPDYLDKVTRALADAPGASMIVSDIHMVLQYQTPPASYVHACRPDPQYPDLVTNLLLENFITTMSCVAVPAACARSAGPLDETLRVVHDKEWYIRLAAFGTAVCTREALVWRTIGEDNLVADEKPFLADQHRFLDGFFGGPLGAKYTTIRWRAHRRVLEGFAAMALGRKHFGDAGRYLLAAYGYTWREWRPVQRLLWSALQAYKAALRARASAALRRLRSARK